MSVEDGRKKKCAGQLFGIWMVEPDWFNRAVAAVKDGTFIPEDQSQEEFTGLVTEDGVAVLPIHGHLTKGGDSFGGQSMVKIRRQFRAAVVDSEVRGIMLHIDSPGGTVDGTADLADDIRDGGKQKPVHAYFEDRGVSGAYWLGSQTARVTANRTASVGSIGAFLELQDVSKKAEKEGVGVHIVRSGTHKGIGHPVEGMNAERLKWVQERIDSVAEEFLGSVQTARGLSDEAIAAIGAEAKVYIGAEAQTVGLIDGVESFGQAMATLKEVTAVTQSEFESFVKENPNSVQTYIDSGVATGTAQAREQMELLVKASDGRPELAIRSFLKGDTPETVQTIVAEVSKVEAKAKADAVISAEALAKATEDSNGVAFNASDSDSTVSKIDPSDHQAVAEAEWNADATLHERFSSKESYCNVRSSELKGLLRVSAREGSK